MNENKYDDYDENENYDDDVYYYKGDKKNMYIFDDEKTYNNNFDYSDSEFESESEFNSKKMHMDMLEFIKEDNRILKKKEKQVKKENREREYIQKENRDFLEYIQKWGNRVNMRKVENYLENYYLKSHSEQNNFLLDITKISIDNNFVDIIELPVFKLMNFF